MIHLNNNLLCVVDVETTGTRVGFHDLIQVCVLPLDSELKPWKGVVPFYMDIKPRRPENCTPELVPLHREKLCRAQISGMDADRAADLFAEWYQKLKLLPNKRISPLAQNWPFDRGFMIDWLGPTGFEEYFDARYRDTMVAALFDNDVADFRAELCPYPKVNLQYLATTLGVLTDRSHDAIQDCLTTAEVYRRLILRAGRMV